MAGLWVRAELRRRWRALLALGLVVGLAGGTVLAATAGARRTATAFDRRRSGSGATHLSIQINHDLSGELDADAGAGFTIRQIIERIRHMPQVEDISLEGFFAAGPPDTFLGFDFTSIAALDAGTGRDVNRFVVKEGRLPDPDAVDEVAFSVSAAGGHVRVGDRVQWASISADRLEKLAFEGDESALELPPDGPPLRLRVVGVITRPDDVGDPDLLTPYAYLTPAFFERYRQEIGVFAPTVGVRLRRGYDDVSAVAAQVRKLVGEEMEVIFDDNRTDVEAVDNGLRVQALALLAFAAAALLATGVAVGQAFTRQLAAAAEDGAVLRTLGLTRRQRAAGLVRLAVPVVVGGVALALVVAALASPLLPLGLAGDAEPHPGFRFDGLVLGGGALALLALLGGLAAAAAWRASRVREATAAAPRVTLGARLAGRLNSGAVTSTGLRMAFDTRPGVPVRSAIAGTVAAVVALVAVVTFGASLRNLTGNPALTGFPWHVDVEGGEDTSTLDEPVAAAVADRDVEAVTVARLVGDILVDGRHTHAIGIRSAKGPAGLTMLAGRSPQGPNEVALGPETMRRLDVGIGDTVEARGQDGRHSLEVVGRALFPVLDNADYNDGALFTTAGLARIETSGYVVEFVRFRPGVESEAKSKALLGESSQSVHGVALPAAVDNLEGAKDFPQALALFLALLGTAAVIHLLLLSGRRWRKDLAVLRGLGLLRGQAARCVAVQAAALGVVSVVIGIPIGVAVGRWTWNLMARALDVVPHAVVPLSVGLVAPAAVVVVLFGSLVPAARAARVRPATALRTE